ncbi:hypothetical protein [Corynebacterium liangguodongii]|uniref:Uncharacterized protein n=1 Tax=Corynebacterium liangguodongii TaxID=2079535 RepID=A0A2S0WG94_9CORY|nr:hypothetical protein [Corynebacterium liangguodongii]AWB84808.1 hypothetical protein C3E79_10250 [Corynebacterium liangguodongii]PWB99165.1 hypothetical protein DF219_07865 [Corynebacterium liangguodongii]
MTFPKQSKTIEMGIAYGMLYEICMGPFSINGYLQLPPGHPWIGSDLERDHDIKVHGGITYRAGRVIGFDTAHAGDGYHPDAPISKAKKLVTFLMSGHVWELEEVREELFRLAVQAHAAEVVE